MSIPMNVLQSLMAINAQSIAQYQIYVQHLKGVAEAFPEYRANFYKEDIRKAKHRMSLLERNQRAMSQEMQELIFQSHVDKLTNVEYNDDLIYH